jgi:hypothetical protein
MAATASYIHYHGKDEIVGRNMEQMIEQAAAADLVHVSNPPDYVNVLIAGVTTWNASDSLLGAEAFVIPVPLSKKSPHQGS